MSGTKQSPDNPIPQFATREEDAEFWDTHDFADYWDEPEQANVGGQPQSDLFNPTNRGFRSVHAEVSLNDVSVAIDRHRH